MNGFPGCEPDDICKRHKAVYRTFIDHNTAGNYWLKPVPHGTLI
jgi:hypothetical protein